MKSDTNPFITTRMKTKASKMLSSEQNDELCDTSFHSAQAAQTMIVAMQLAQFKKLTFGLKNKDCYGH
jgi:hypothetical protein